MTDADRCLVRRQLKRIAVIVFGIKFKVNEQPAADDYQRGNDYYDVLFKEIDYVVENDITGPLLRKICLGQFLTENIAQDQNADRIPSEDPRTYSQREFFSDIRIIESGG